MLSSIAVGAAFLARKGLIKVSGFFGHQLQCEAQRCKPDLGPCPYQYSCVHPQARRPPGWRLVAKVIRAAVPSSTCSLHC